MGEGHQGVAASHLAEDGASAGHHLTIAALVVIHPMVMGRYLIMEKFLFKPIANLSTLDHAYFSYCYHSCTLSPHCDCVAIAGHQYMVVLFHDSFYASRHM